VASTTRRSGAKEAAEDDLGGRCSDGHGAEQMAVTGGRRGDRPSSAAHFSGGGGLPTARRDEQRCGVAPRRRCQRFSSVATARQGIARRRRTAASELVAVAEGGGSGYELRRGGRDSAVPRRGGVAAATGRLTGGIDAAERKGVWCLLSKRAALGVKTLERCAPPPSVANPAEEGGDRATDKRALQRDDFPDSPLTQISVLGPCKIARKIIKPGENY
jgi:hypothetical protein